MLCGIWNPVVLWKKWRNTKHVQFDSLARRSLYLHNIMVATYNFQFGMFPKIVFPEQYVYIFCLVHIRSCRDWLLCIANYCSPQNRNLLVRIKMSEWPGTTDEAREVKQQASLSACTYYLHVITEALHVPGCVHGVVQWLAHYVRKPVSAMTRAAKLQDPHYTALRSFSGAREIGVLLSW